MSSPTSDWIALDRSHVWHPYTQMLTAPPPIPVSRAEGVYLHTADGRRILDGISSWWLNIHGHNHPRLNDALSRQASEIAQVIFAGFSHEPAARLAARLSELAPGKPKRVFFSDDGSTAVEVALKMAYQHWRNRGEERRDLFVALEHAYHGDTFGAMAAGGIPVFQEAYRDLLFEVRRAHAPTCHACPVGEERATCRIECLGSPGSGLKLGREGRLDSSRGPRLGPKPASSLGAILENEGNRVAAVIVEPMLQGAGGMIVWPTEFLRGVRKATAEHGIPLIADEVLTGFGRTGKVFACEHGPVAPDIICVSKALTGGYLPLGATLASDDIYAAFLSDRRERTLFHGHSYTGNALSCAVALESLRLLEEIIAQGRLRELERLFQGRIERLRSIPCVLDARGIGVMAAVEIRPTDGGYLDRLGPWLYDQFLARGILLRPLGNVVYFLPPYVIRDEEAHLVFDAIEEVLELVPSAPRA